MVSTKILSKSSTAVAVGLAGVLALGACSSGSDQASSDREAAAAPASPSPAVIVPPLKSGPFKTVTVTHAPTVSCGSREFEKKLVINCDKVGTNYVGDPVFVRVPGRGYRIDVANAEGSSSPITSVQRDWAYFEITRDTGEYSSWGYPDLHSAGDVPWGVGVSSGSWNYVHTVITVTKR